MLVRRASAVVALALLVGCAAPVPPPSGAASLPPPPPAAGLPGPFDGTYRTRSYQTVSRFGAACNVVRGPDRLRIAQSRGRIAWRSILVGPVNAAGVVELAGDGGNTLNGRIAGTTFTGRLQTPYCRYELVMEKS